jgi:hypothetical protein
MAKPLEQRDWSLWLALLIFLIALVPRLFVITQSLWYDEMFTLIHFINAPWKDIVSGHYSPNNHVLFTLLAKTCNTLFSSLGPEIAIRLPSLLAGAAAAAALAWPLLKTRPVPGLLLGFIAALHPWLLSFSGWARGYALLMFLAVLSTLLLTKISEKWGARAYSLAIAALLYTHPIGIGVVIGHGLFCLLHPLSSILHPRSPLLRRWFIAASAAGLLTALLYLPFLSGAKGYWAAPEKPTTTYAQFILQSLRHADGGMNTGGFGAILLPLLLCTVGLILAWRLSPLRPLIVTFATASLFALLAPIGIKLAGEARAALWLIPIYCLGLIGILAAIPCHGRSRWIRVAGCALALVVLISRDVAIANTPGQPITDALSLIQRNFPKNTPTVGVYMTSAETKALYDDHLLIAYNLDALKQVEQNTPQGRVLLVFYEEFIQRDEPKLWADIQTRYILVHHLPGRVSGISIYKTP